MSDLAALDPGGTLLIPLMVSTSPVMLVIKRCLHPSDRCCLTVITTDARLLEFHPSISQPPKFKCETALELLDVSFDRLRDEALWVGFWHVATQSTSPGEVEPKSRLSPAEIFYQVNEP